MVKFRSLRALKHLAVGALIALAPMSASALGVTFGDTRIIETNDAGATASGPTSPTSFGFSWVDTGPGNTIRYYQQFTTTSAFDLVLDSYSESKGAKALLLPGLVLGGGSNLALASAKLSSASSGSALFEDLIAGDYTLFSNQFGFSEEGAASFSLVGKDLIVDVAAVPLPLSVLMLA